MLWLIGAIDRDADVIRLVFPKGRENSVQLLELEPCDLFIQMFGEGIDTDGVFTGIAFNPKFDLCDGLIGEA